MGILETICEERREAVRRAKLEAPPSSLKRDADAPRLAPSLAASAAAWPRGLIAECKKASPSRGIMVKDYDPVRLALAYERGGASMVSVLTEPLRFLGSPEHLGAVCAAIALPVLRKDFIVDPYQVLEAWAMGADAVLLIASALRETEMAELSAAAHELGLAVLAEVRVAGEIERSIAAKPDAIGVNSRDLRDFSVDTGRAAALASLLPPGVPKIAESGIASGEEAAALGRAGFDGFLVGEALATAPDPEAATRRIAEAIKERQA
jgi:indole-3-glycerol phosphate synthase